MSDQGNVSRRFVPPLRGQVHPACFDHPLLAPFACWDDLIRAPHWPGMAALNAAAPVAGACFVAQDTALLGDGLHYEQRIAAGRIATRAQNWHDFFNALVWARYPAIKRALNRRQCAAIAEVGNKTRNAAQQALTQFDESGLVVRVRDPALLAAWDAHHWQTLFVDQAPAWQRGDIAVVASFGHALLEQCLLPGRRLVGKALVVVGEDDAAAIAHVAGAIAGARVLQAASELRPLPLAGIAGWQAAQDAAFYRDADYFRPLREGRTYPSPLQVPG